MLVVIVIVVLVPHVVHGCVISMAESIAIVVSQITLHRRAAIARMVVSIALPVPLPVVPRRFKAVAESLPLHVAVLARRFIPAPLTHGRVR